jgi:hypothetical protein
LDFLGELTLSIRSLSGYWDRLQKKFQSLIPTGLKFSRL